MNYSIQINGKRYGLVSRFSVPKYLATEYCTMPFTLYFGSESISIDATEICFLCNRNFSQATRACPLLCTNIDINHQLGYVGRICVDCYYFLAEKNGYEHTPISIRKVLDSGFHPVNLGKYLSVI